MYRVFLGVLSIPPRASYASCRAAMFNSTQRSPAAHTAEQTTLLFQSQVTTADLNQNQGTMIQVLS